VKTDEPSQNTKQDGEPCNKSDLPERIEAPAPKSEITPPQPPIPPAMPPHKFDGDPSGGHNDPEKQCPKEISVSIKKDPELSRFEKWSMGLSWATFIVVVLTFLVFYGQLCESKRQTAILKGQAEQATTDAALTRKQTEQQIFITKDQFRVDQRPVIWSIEPGRPNLAIGQIPTWRIPYSNYGRSTALGVFCKSQIVWGPDIISLKLDHLEIKPRILAYVFNNVHRPGEQGHGIVVPPGYDKNSCPTFAPRTLTKEDAEFIISHDGGIALIAHFEYYDSLGNTYHTEMCRFMGRDGNPKSCDTHNTTNR
jgi:hypothetical protein